MRAKLVNESLTDTPIVYRCGWCGNITDENGEALDKKKWEEAKEILDIYGDKYTIRVNGECCRGEQENFYEFVE
jgi:hypothetical protein